MKERIGNIIRETKSVVVDTPIENLLQKKSNARSTTCRN